MGALMRAALQWDATEPFVSAAPMVVVAGPGLMQSLFASDSAAQAVHGRRMHVPMHTLADLYPSLSQFASARSLTWEGALPSAATMSDHDDDDDDMDDDMDDNARHNDNAEAAAESNNEKRR